MKTHPENFGMAITVAALLLSAELDLGLHTGKAAMISDAIERYGLRSIMDVGACYGALIGPIEALIEDRPPDGRALGRAHGVAVPSPG